MLRVRMRQIEESDDGFPLLQNIGIIFLDHSFFDHNKDKIKSLGTANEICEKTLMRYRSYPEDWNKYLYEPIKKFFLSLCKTVPDDADEVFCKWFDTGNTVLKQITTRYQDVEEALGYLMFPPIVHNCTIPYNGEHVTIVDHTDFAIEYFLCDRVIWFIAICDFLIEQMVLGKIPQSAESVKLYEWLRAIKILWSFEASNVTIKEDHIRLSPKVDKLRSSNDLKEILESGNFHAEHVEDEEENRDRDAKLNFGPQQLLNRQYIDDLMDTKDEQFDFTPPPGFPKDPS